VPKKLLPFPQPKPVDPPVPGATQGSRVIFGIGNQRFALDFYRKITPINPEPAPLVAMKRRKGRKRSSQQK